MFHWGHPIFSDNNGDLPDDWEDDFIESENSGEEEEELEDEEDSSFCDSNEYDDFDFNDAYFTNNDFYVDEKTPKIVEFSAKGLLTSVQREAKDGKACVINTSRRWTEVEEKWGYDKSWEWHDDTPLIAAARNGHFDIVHYLLSVGADPTLESCHTCDVTGNASKAASKGLQSIMHQKCQTDKITKFEKIIEVLKIAESYWNKASYASARFSKERKKKFEKCPNQPTNEAELKAELLKFIVWHFN